MSQVAHLQDLVDYLQKGVKGQETAEKPVVKELEPLTVTLHKEFQNSVARERVTKLLNAGGAFNGPSNLINKDVTGVDLGPVRVVSLYPIIAQVYNLDTVFLNILKRRAPFIMTDTECRIPEENIGSDQVPTFHVEGALPSNMQATLSERGNTAQALGQGINVSYMAEELAAQSPYKRNEIQDQFQKAAIRLERTLNPVLLNSVENNNWSLAGIPTMGGFVTRSTNGSIATSGNLTDALIVQAMNVMNAIYGFEQVTDVAVLCGAAQISVVRNLMINRYPGNDPMAKLSYDTVLAKRLMTQGIEPSEVTMIYEDNNGVSIPFIREPQLPPGVALFFRTGVNPQLAAFKWGGQMPPWTIERPISTLYHLSVFFGIYSLADPLVSSRVTVTGLNS